MPSLATIRTSNSAFFRSGSAATPVAVFVGGTSGIGEGMALTFAELTKGKSHIIIIGRNQTSAERIFAAMPSPPHGDETYGREFVQCDSVLMKNVQSATEDILSKHPKINHLVLSMGIASLAGREETSEGIDKKMALHYYARWKFIHDLLPALQKAKEDGERATVISIKAAGKGGAIDLEDLPLKKAYSVSKAAVVLPTYNDLMMENAPDITFIHAYPGFVRTPLSASSDSLALRISSALIMPLARPLSVSNTECGQYMWHAICSTANTPGARRIGSKGEDLGKKRYFGDENQRQKVWQHTEETIKTALETA